jgi:hypothetical protein
MEKVKVMSCMQIAMLDIDGFRMDKAFQAPLDTQASGLTTNAIVPDGMARTIFHHGRGSW